MLGAVFALTTFLKSGLGRRYYIIIRFEVETCKVLYFKRSCSMFLLILMQISPDY